MDVIKKNVIKNYNTILYKDFNYLSDSDGDLFFEYYPKNGSVWKTKESSNEEDFFVKNYSNILAHANSCIRTIVLEKNEDKISFKIFTNIRTKREGKFFFKKSTQLTYITYSYKTGDLYSGDIENYHRKRKWKGKGKKTSISKNCFFKKPINKFLINLKSLTSSYNQNPDSGSIVNDYLNLFCEELKIPKEYANSEKIDLFFYKSNMLKKGFKLPDNYSVFSRIFPLLNKKDSKKFEGKFIDAVMSRLNLKGKRFKKILHSINTYNNSHLFLYKVFGKEFINSFSDEYIKKLFENDYNSHFHLDVIKDSKLLKSKKFIEVFKLVIDNIIDVTTFIDHIMLYNKLNKYEFTEWKSEDLFSFRNEHIDYSNRIEYYNNGYYKRYYHENFTNLIEKEINVGKVTYKPVILFDTNSYVEESSFQSNCVKTYIKRPEAFIISLRNQNERATLEYRIFKENNKIEMVRVQSRFKFNGGIPESWEPALEILDNRIQKFLSENDFILPNITVNYNNGKNYMAVMKFNDGIKYPVWDTSDLLLSSNTMSAYEEQPF